MQVRKYKHLEMNLLQLGALYTHREDNIYFSSELYKFFHNLEELLQLHIETCPTDKKHNT